MATLNFNLRTVNLQAITPILLIVRIQGIKLCISTKTCVSVSEWDKRTQRGIGKKNKHLNTQLDVIASYVRIQIQNLENENKTIDIYQLKKRITHFISEQKSTENYSFFWDVFDAFVAFKKKTTQTHKEYDLALRKHLIATEQHTGIPVTFEALHYTDQGFIEGMRNYMLYEAINQQGKKGLRTNTIWKQFKNLKAFINWCVDQNYISRFSTKHLAASTEHVDTIYLTENELYALERLTLTGESKTVRDLFLLSCETGLRFSDLCTLSAISHNQEYLEVYPKKTRKQDPNKRIIIPFSARAKRVIVSNQGKIPSYAYSKINQFNHLLKVICKQANINSVSSHFMSIQGKEVFVSFPKYELVSSHTGRRTFCTLKFLAGMPSHAIMKFSGHTTEQNFLRYLKLDAEVVAHRYRRFF